MSAQDRTVRVTTTGGAKQLRLFSGFLVSGSGRTLANGRTLRIGSDPGCDVVLADPSVSRHHATLEDTRDGFRLRDEGSTNGTVVNGLPAREVFLVPGAILKLGNQVLQFVLDEKRIGPDTWPEDFYHGMRGRSLPMRQLFGFLERVADSDLTLLLTGETGTGKEEAARALHAGSGRAEKPFVVFDGATTEPTLVGATLFGQKEGAFTGATRSRQGSFQSADGGTLFIDEVGEIPLDIQPKLLRVLERGEVQPLGSDSFQKVDVRVLSATHRDLQEMVKKGQFREDLFYRLSGLIIEIPALRERREDVMLLAEHFLEKRAPGKKLGVSAIGALAASDWPGNVRELRNVLHRAATLCRGDMIEAEHLVTGPVRFTGGGVPDTAGVPKPGVRPLTLEEREKEAILEVLASTGWNLTLAAEILGSTRQTLRRKLDQYGIEKPVTE